MVTKRIMIIDDETSFTKLVKINLERTGRFAACVVNNPLEALALAQIFKPHLILLDVMMPNKDGGKILAELEADEKLKNVPVLFLTASTISQLARAQQTAGCVRPVIAKPVDPKELTRRIDEVLRSSIFSFHLGWGRKK